MRSGKIIVVIDDNFKGDKMYTHSGIQQMVGSILEHTPGSIQTSPEGPESFVQFSRANYYFIPQTTESYPIIKKRGMIR